MNETMAQIYDATDQILGSLNGGPPVLKGPSPPKTIDGSDQICSISLNQRNPLRNFRSNELSDDVYPR
jgi:hypothetical protein